jgi:hypothetical protein
LSSWNKWFRGKSQDYSRNKGIEILSKTPHLTTQMSANKVEEIKKQLDDLNLKVVNLGL